VFPNLIAEDVSCGRRRSSYVSEGGFGLVRGDGLRGNCVNFSIRTWEDRPLRERDRGEDKGSTLLYLMERHGGIQYATKEEREKALATGTGHLYSLGLIPTLPMGASCRAEGSFPLRLARRAGGGEKVISRSTRLLPLGERDFVL